MGNFITKLNVLSVSFMLFAFGAVAQSQASEPVQTEPQGHIMLLPSDLKWVDAPNSLPPGAKVAILEGDPSKPGPYTMRIKMPANYKIMPHWHPDIEHVTVLEGEFYMGKGDVLEEMKAMALPVGGFSAIPIKAHHYAFTKSKPAIIQLHGIGPFDIIYLDPANDPRKKK